MTTTSQTTRSAHTQIDRETILPFLLRIALSDQLTLAHVIAVSSMNGIFGEEIGTGLPTSRYLAALVRTQ